MWEMSTWSRKPTRKWSELIIYEWRERFVGKLSCFPSSITSVFPGFSFHLRFLNLMLASSARQRQPADYESGMTARIYPCQELSP